MRVSIFWLLFFAQAAFAGEENLVKAFFSREGIADKRSVYTGEMLALTGNPTIGEALSPDVKVQARLLEQSSEREIFAVALSKGGLVQDWYIYLARDAGVWKLSAVRTLALPGMFNVALKQIEARKNRTEEEEHTYQNMLLTVKPDSELKDYLQKNIAVFEGVARDAKNNLPRADVSAKQLHLSSVKYDPASGTVDLLIGGILDNSVGYIFVPDGAAAPAMTDDNYIYVEKVVGSWYIYKTT